MKIIDDYKAKIRLWASNPVVVPLPPMPKLPPFSCRRFRSHEEMNAWKKEYLREIARSTETNG